MRIAEGHYIVTHDGNEFLTTVDGEYIWGATEVLDSNGDFDHWSAPTRISGRNGIPNEYTEYRFQKNGSSTNPPAVDITDPTPSGWTVEMPDISAVEYLWLIKANKLPDGTLVSAWSDPVRTNGVDGSAAGQGDPGPFMQFRGEWNKDLEGNEVHKQYTGNAQHIDAVKYNGSWYVARMDAGDIPIDTLPTDTTYWNTFAGEFESIATGLLLADLAYIKNLGVSWLRTSETGKRIELKGDDNNLIFYDEFGNEVLRIDDDIDSSHAGNPLAGMRVTDPVAGRVAYITGNGLFSNSSGMSFLPSLLGIENNASLVGLLFERNTDSNGISAAIAGIDQTTTGNSKSFGGYFNSAFAGELYIGSHICDENETVYTVGDGVTLVTYYAVGGSTRTITLPPSPKEGRTVYIKPLNDSVEISSPVYGIIDMNGANRSSVLNERAKMSLFIFSGGFWIQGYMK